MAKPPTNRTSGTVPLPLVLVVATLVVILLVAGLFLSGALRTPGQDPSPTAASTPATTAASRHSPTYPTTPPPSGPVLDPTATLTPVLPTATSLGEFVPAKVDDFRWTKVDVDTKQVEAGAEAAERGTFTSGDEQIGAAMAEWPSAEEARARTKADADAQAAGKVLVSEGQIMNGAGYFWYYERDAGAEGFLWWYHGKFSAQFVGDPREVQTLFVRFPR